MAAIDRSDFRSGVWAVVHAQFFTGWAVSASIWSSVPFLLAAALSGILALFNVARIGWGTEGWFGGNSGG